MSSDAAAAFGAPEERKRGSTAGYWLAGLLAIAAVGGAIAWFVTGLTGIGDRVDDLQRVGIPGSGVVTLEAGKNAIYYEGRGHPGVDLGLVPADGGPPVVIGPHSGDTTYSVSGHKGHSIAGFKLERAGDYRLTVVGDAPPGAVVAVGKGVGGQIVKAVVGGLGIFFGGLLLAGLAIILTARRR